MPKPSELSDPYEILEIDFHASGDEIKKAYYKLAQKYHPDHNLGNEESSKLEFIAVGEAYEKLNSKKSGREKSGERGFDYYNGIFEDILYWSKEFSKSENPTIKFIGELMKRNFGSFGGF